ncbi:MAG TPA: CHAT domain-containing protein [Pyrinomonadaceae bacterium]|jgi:CHAT domain-containing protein/tetratricopeptide (TPR) repeat protein
MLRADLAEKLISAESETGRKRLLSENNKHADVKLAVALKKICYAAWTTEPIKAQKAAKALKTLVKINPHEEISALSYWVSGIAELTGGRLESAVRNLDRAAAIFFQTGKEHDAAQTQVAKLIALAMLGRYDEAIETSKKTLKIFEKYGDELAAGKIEMNLSNIVSRREMHTQAEKYCLSARRRFLKTGEKTWLTMAENGLANTYTELNDFQKAEKFYASALQNARESKMLVTEAEIKASQGNLALFRGRFSEALKSLELSRQTYETLEMPHQTAIAELEIADIYLELNLAKEAFSIYEKVTEELRKLKLQGEEARARANFGRAAAGLNETKQARRQLKKSAQLYSREKNKVGAAVVKLTEANLEIEQGKFKKALDLAGEAANLLAGSENLRHQLMNGWIRAEALRNLEAFEKAETLLNEVFTGAAKREQPQIVHLALNSLGKLFRQKGDVRQAEKFFKKAIKLIETLRSPLPAEEFRMAFLANKLAPFENLARIYLAENKIKAAFLMIEKARSRSLAESIADGNLKLSKNTASTKLTKRLEALREELNWFYSRLSRAEKAEIANLQAEAQKREKQIADVLRQIESTGENSAAKGESFDFAKLQKQIGGEKALIEFVSFDNCLSAFVITNKKIHFVKDLAKETQIFAFLEGLQFQFGALRYGAKSLGKFIDELKKRADFYLAKLYAYLVKPLENLLENRDLTIVPVGVLHYVPFHALRARNEKYLLEKRKVTYAPSATVWQFLEEKPTRKIKNALLIGFADEKIPLVNREIETLEKIFPKAKTFSGKAATFEAYTKNAPQFDALHLACHGQFRPENPLFSSLHLADGWVTVRDICAQRLNAELVTLSACETGLNEIFAGDEILGLARGFLTAGARSLVLSLWTVNDEATTELMREFYTQLEAGKETSKALQIAQRSFIRRNAHPYFWSPFALIGK